MEIKQTLLRVLASRLAAQAAAVVVATATTARGFVLEAVMFGGLWLLQWVLFPTWLVSSTAGLQTLGQGLAGTIVAIFVLALGSSFVLAQQAVSLYGTRAALLVMTDRRVTTLLLRAFALTVAALVIGAETPAAHPAHWLTAAAATVTIAAAWLILSAILALIVGFSVYTAPVSFVQRALEDIAPLLRSNVLLVAYKVPLFSEMAALAIRRGDSAALRAAIGGLLEFQAIYIDAARQTPSVRFKPQLGSTSSREGWLGDELSDAFVKAGEQSLKLVSNEQDNNLIADAIEAAARRAIQAGQDIEAGYLAVGLMHLGTTVHQVRAETVNLWPQSAGALARATREARMGEASELAAETLAGWALVVAYPLAHFGTPHPSFVYSVEDLGEAPPFGPARQVVLSNDWQRTWTNKMPGGFEVCLEVLDAAEAIYRGSPEELEATILGAAPGGESLTGDAS